MSKGGGNAIGRGHRRLGVMPCLVCTREIPVKVTPGGKLSCHCTWCDAPIYINPHTEAHDLVMKRVKLDAPPAAAPGATASDPGIPKPLATPPAPPAAEAEKKDPPRRSFGGPLFGTG